jgi:hypothetical protein
MGESRGVSIEDRERNPAREEIKSIAQGCAQEILEKVELEVAVAVRALNGEPALLAPG